MEGNACYKFSTIKNFILKTQAKDITTIVDVGVNVGDISVLMHDYFPNARIIGFEPVREYFDIAVARTRDIPQIELHHQAVTAQHRFLDDLGEIRRDDPASLVLMKSLPSGGPGWTGGSIVLPTDHEYTCDGNAGPAHVRTSDAVSPITLAEIMEQERLQEIDILKLDCEGCEHSVLGCATPETLRRVRFITGEYHGITRFNEVMRRKLFATHKVNLVGASDLGCFFAERRDGDLDGLLLHDNAGVLMPRPWLCATPIEWHMFDERFVLPADRLWHGMQ